MSDDKLWMLHIQGPDDVVAAPSKNDADRVASAFNAYWTAHLAKQRAMTEAAGGDPDNWPTVHAVVVEWDSTPAAHARSVAKYWPEYAGYLAMHSEGDQQ